MRNPSPKYIIVFFIIFYLVGLVGLSLSRYRELFQMLTPLNLLISAFILFFYNSKWDTKHIIAFVVVLIFGYGVELLGVSTGVVFGSYSYGETLGLKIGGTPLLIGVNWLMLIYMVYLITGNLKIKASGQIILGAFLMVMYDLFLEPVAIRLDFWSWGNGIPIQNYLAWWLISVLFFTIWNRMKIKVNNPIAPTLFIIQFIFFVILNITL